MRQGDSLEPRNSRLTLDAANSIGGRGAHHVNGKYTFNTSPLQITIDNYYFKRKLASNILRTNATGLILRTKHNSFMKVAQCFEHSVLLLHNSLLNTTEQAKRAQRTDHPGLRRNMLTHQEDIIRGNYDSGTLTGNP